LSRDIELQVDQVQLKHEELPHNKSKKKIIKEKIKEASLSQKKKHKSSS